MIRTMAKALAYSKAPKTTFALQHPRQSVRLAKTRWDLKHALAPRITAVGAAIVALPLGFLIGRMARHQNGDHV